MDAILEAVREALPPAVMSSFRDEVSAKIAEGASGWNRYRTAVLKMLEGKS